MDDQKNPLQIMAKQQAEIVTISLLSHVIPFLLVLFSYPDTFAKSAYYILVGWTSSFMSGRKHSQTFKENENKKGPCGLEAFRCEHEGKRLL